MIRSTHTPHRGFGLGSLMAAVAVVCSLAAGQQGRAADIIVTVNGNITSASPGMGYAVNDPVSFFWVVNDYAPATPVGNTSNSDYTWKEEQASEPQLWANVGGTGIGGTFTRAPGAAPWERLITRSTSTNFEIRMDTDSFSTSTNNHGLYLNANPSYLMRKILFNAQTNATFGGFGGPLPNPTDYMANYVGTFGVTSTVDGQIIGDNGQQSLIANFAATSVTIAQVPEPSTYALAAIATGVIAAIARRRKARRA